MVYSKGININLDCLADNKRYLGDLLYTDTLGAALAVQHARSAISKRHISQNCFFGKIDATRDEASSAVVIFPKISRTAPFHLFLRFSPKVRSY